MKKSKDNVNSPPSLLEPQSRGGEIGEGGINFQADVVSSMVPKWLADEGFTSMVRESMGDTEAKFFVPGIGYKKEFVEVKDHEITVSTFWEEIDRFQQIAGATEDEYRSFTVACPAVHRLLKPMAAQLGRMIGPRQFYENSQILENSFAEFCETVKGRGRDVTDAVFLFNRVQLIDTFGAAKETGRILFRQSLTENFPDFGDLSEKRLDTVYEALSTFVRDRPNKTISRSELTGVIREALPTDSPLREEHPIRIHTSIDRNQSNGGPLTFAWADFFGGSGRDYPAVSEWNDRLVKELTETKQWVLKNRHTRRLRLTGERRLSAAMAMGSVFSAVSGFSIETQHRGNVYATNSHASESTPDYELMMKMSGPAQGDRLVVTIGIIRDVESDVNEFLNTEEMTENPRLDIKGIAPVVSAEQANLVVGKVKRAISEMLLSSRAKHIDLFIAAPSFLTLFLGYRLNATAPVQCYEWIGTGRYHQTCTILT